MKVIADAPGLAPYRGSMLVPTMGALHEGHLTLIREAVRRRETLPGRPPVLVSIFVNPTQFNDPADLARYPRTLDADAAGCERAGADAIFAPSPETIYPPDQTIPIPPLPDVATRPGLEDARRPGHFAGVCQVVARLFDLVRPAAAFFGEKDWQQLQVITAMTHQERLPVQIVPVPTVREPDGLAMSSRNVFLAAKDRHWAAALHWALRNAAEGAQSPREAEVWMHRILMECNVNAEYAVVRDAESLMPIPDGALTNRPMRALIAARLGAVRLIDNAPWPA